MRSYSGCSKEEKTGIVKENIDKVSCTIFLCHSEDISENVWFGQYIFPRLLLTIAGQEII